MVEGSDCLELVRLARLGDKKSMAQLVAVAEKRLRAYIRKVTLDPDSSQDLLQECLLEIVSSLSKLEDIGRFWPWLFRIATRKIQQHYRERRHNQIIDVSTLKNRPLSHFPEDENHRAIDDLVRKELVQRVYQAFAQLNPKQRVVLTLRCFEDMPYADIGVALRCSSLGARLLFFRARRRLQLQLK